MTSSHDAGQALAARRARSPVIASDMLRNRNNLGACFTVASVTSGVCRAGRIYTVDWPARPIRLARLR